MTGFGGNEIARANDKKEQAADAPVMFETLEPRILMNSSFIGLDAHLAPSTNAQQVIVQNADRDHGDGSIVTDHLTNNPAVVGQVTDRDNDFVKLTGGFDQTSSKNFADLTSAVKSDGTFLLDKALLQQLAGGTLADGAHMLHLNAFDAEGHSSALDLQFTLDTVAPTLSAKLAHDTGASATDGITNDDTIVGKALDSTDGIAGLTGGFDKTSAANFVDLTSSLRSDGTFVLDPHLLNQIARAGSVDGHQGDDHGLADGQHTLHLTALDNAGNATAFDVSFTLKTTPPQSPSFDLAPADVNKALEEHVTDAGKVTFVGTTDANVTVTLAVPGSSAVLSTISDAKGKFEFVDVNLAIGRNVLTATATDVAGNSQDFSLNIQRVNAVPKGDAVLQWNQITLNTIQLAALDPVMASRVLAIESVAVLDTINAIDGTHGFLVQQTAKAGTSADAAVAAAAHEVLDVLFPGQKTSLDAQYQAGLAQIGTGSDDRGSGDDRGDGERAGDKEDDQNTSIADGIALGTSIADQVIALRANDGSQVLGQFDGGTNPGQWQSTGPNFGLAIRPEFANVTPFAMSSPDQFLSTIAPPPALTSTDYASAVNEVGSLGSANSTTRTADQTQIAQFWSDGLGTLTEAGQWNQIAASVAQKQGNSLADDARLFGKLNVGLADAGIATWNAKYNFDYWSPVTAIQSAASTGNTGTKADPNFTSLVSAPEVPEFVETQASFGSTAADILGNFFGQNVSFSATSGAGATRSYSSFAQAAQEAGRSGIYAGTDFQFSNVAGQSLGQKVGDLVLQAFDISKDTVPPKVLLDQPAKGLVTNKDPVITGHVLDNLAGVASLQVKLDNGSLMPVSFDATGKFSVPVNLALDGSADGQHTLTFIATDAVGNATAPLSVSFTLATKGPQLSFTNGLTDGVAIQAGTGLIGTATTAAGVNLTGLSYKFDNGTSTSVVFDTTNSNSFDQAFDLSQLGVGAHQLTVTATDAAGKVTVQNFAVSLPALIPLTITAVNPANGAGTVGVSFRPLVTFSRAVDLSTLTSDSFFLTDSAGNKIATTIVPWNDHMHAWLFPAGEGMPGGQNITLHVDGSKILGAADGAALDAAGTGQAGSVFTDTFSTVNDAKVAGTSISGQIVDPGPKLDIGTTDSPNPIAGVTVYILGHEDEAVQTDAQGRFSFASAPVGDVKVVIDGRTATNAPKGISFPVLVVDLNVKPGQDNTIEGSRGSVEAQLANATNQQLFLPRLNTDVMQTLNQNAPTVLRTTADSSPTLTAEQLQQMTLTVQPGTLIGEDGKPLPATAQVGFSVVPRDTIKDMLPVGLAQHSFDLTIQAPGLSSFTTPATLTLPNVFKLPPGSKANLLTFDYTTGRLEVDGTCTVSADGKTVTTDPGAGVTKIGWHSMTPAGSLTKNEPAPAAKCDVISFVADTGATLLKEGLKCLAEIAGPLSNALKLGADVISLLQKLSSIKAEFAQAAADPANNVAQLKSLQDSLKTILPVATDLIALVLGTESPVGPLKTGIECGAAACALLAETIDNMVKDNCVPFFLAGVIENARDVVDKINAVVQEAKAAIEPLLTLDGTSLIKFIVDTIDNITKFVGGPGFAEPLAGAAFGLTGRASTIGDPALLINASNDLAAIESAGAPLIAGIDTLANLPPINADELSAANDAVYNVAAGSAPNAPYAFTLPDGNVIRGRSDANGAIQAFLPPNTVYQFGILDTRYNRFAIATGTTSPSGTPTDLPTLHYQNFEGLPDSNGDGVPDVVKAIVGLNPNGRTDQIIPGMRDLEALDEGLDATSKSLTTTTGIVASVPMQGEAQAVAVVGSTSNSNQQTAYIATGSFGLAIVDATNAKNPIVVSQLKLAGIATDVAVDDNLHIAAVATGTGGLQLVNVENPAQPILIQTVVLNGRQIDATQVKVRDGIAYVNDGTAVDAIDLATGTVLQPIGTLDAGAGSSATVTSLGIDGSKLYALDASNQLSIVDIGFGEMVVQGQVSVRLVNTIPGASGKLFVGGGIAYVSDGAAGYVTVDVSNPAAPTVLASGSFADGIAGGAIALNGSGLGVTVGQLTNNPGSPNLLDLVNTSDPTRTNRFITSYTLPVNPFEVAIGEGIAFVADGTAGLQVVNYEAADTKGVAPTIQITSAPTSVNPNASGVQLVEGQTISFGVKVADDVQVRNVELLATITNPDTGVTNTMVLKNSVSFPFDLSAALPTLKILDGVSQVTLQIRATDTGGNVTLSPPMDVTLLPDTTGPRLISQSVPDGSARSTFPGSVTFNFSKPLDLNTVNNSTFFLVGPNGSQIPVSVTQRNDGRTVEVAYNQALSLGQYQLEIDAANVNDRAGNAFGASIFTTHFTVEQITDQWIGPQAGGLWTDAANWSAGRVPNAADSVLVNVVAGGSVSVGGGGQLIGSLVQTGGGTLSIDSGSLTVASQATIEGELAVHGTFTANGGTTIDSLVAQDGGTMIANGDTTIGSLTLTRGTLAGTGNVIVTGAATLVESKMIGTGTTISQGVLTINQGFTKLGLGLDDGRVLENQGTVNWLGGDIDLNPNDTGGAAAGIIRNDVGAVFNSEEGGRILAANFGDADNGASALFDNRGTFNVNRGFVFSDALFTNSGRFQVNNGAGVELHGGGIQSGSFSGDGSVTLFSANPGTSFDFTSASSISVTSFDSQDVDVKLEGSVTIGANDTAFFQAGNISITGTVAGSGDVTIHGAAVSVAANAIYTLTGTTSVDAGMLTFPGPVTLGTLNISNSGTVEADAGTTVATLNQSGGVLTGSGIVTVTGATLLLGGIMTGTGATIAQGGLTIDSAGATIAGGRTLENQGVANWIGDSMQFGAPGITSPTGLDGIFRNDVGAVFNANVNNGFAQISSVDGPAAGLFDNRGTFRQIGAASPQIGVAFTNSGTLEIDSNGLALNGGGHSTGSITVGRSTSLTVNADFTIAGGSVAGNGSVTVFEGTVAIEAPAQYALAGTTNIEGGSLQFDVNATTASFTQFGGLLTGTGNLTVTGSSDLEGGAMGGSGSTIAVGGLTIRGSGIAIGDGRVLENRGDAEWLAGDINLNPLGDGNPAGGIFRNDASATFNQRFNGARLSGSSGALFDNLGAYYKGVNGPPAGTPPATVVSAGFNNAGELHVNDGVMHFTGPFTSTGTAVLAAAATVMVDSDPAFGTLNFRILSGPTPQPTLIQITEGSTVSFGLNVTDAATITRVELVAFGANGTSVLATSTGSPFSLSAALPSILANLGSQQLSLQIRATDNLGVIRLSDPINLQLTLAVRGFSIVNQNIHNGDTLTTPAPQFVVDFGAAVDPATINASTFKLFGSNGVVIPPADIEVSNLNRRVTVTYGQLSVAGEYKLQIDAAKVTDQSGNPLGTNVLTTQFSDTPQFSDTWIGATGGAWNNAANWSAGHVPGASDDVLINLGANQTVTYDGTIASIRSLVVTGGATLSINSGQLTTTAIAAIDGTLNVAGGFTVDGAATIGSLNLTGVLGGTGVVTVTGATVVRGGEMTGTGTTIAQGGLTIDSFTTSTTIAGGRTLENRGVANWISGPIQFGAPGITSPTGLDGTFRNDVGAVFNANVNRGFAHISSVVDSPAAALFDNQGTFHQMGTAQPQIGVAFTNSGTLEIDGNGLAFLGGGTSTGSIVIGGSTSLNFNQFLTNAGFMIAGGNVIGSGRFAVFAGTVAVESPAQYNFTGSTDVEGGTLQLDVNATTGSFTQFGGLLTGTGTFTVTGSTDLEGGAMGGAGTMIAAGGLTINGGGIAIGDGRVLENQGDAEWLGGDINLNPLGDGNPAGGIFRNDASAIFNQRFNGARILGSAGTSALFDNQGAYYKGINGPPSGPPPATVISANFNNAGELRINDNTVRFTATFTDAGMVTIATGATMAISGDVALQPTSVLNIGIGNKGVSGLLTVGGNITLAGTLNAVPDAGFVPTVGQTFKFLTFGTETGAFATVGGTALGGAVALSLDTTDTNDFRFDVVTAPTTASKVQLHKTSNIKPSTPTSSQVASPALKQATGTR